MAIQAKQIFSPSIGIIRWNECSQFCQKRKIYTQCPIRWYIARKVISSNVKSISRFACTRAQLLKKFKLSIRSSIRNEANGTIAASFTKKIFIVVDCMCVQIEYLAQCWILEYWSYFPKKMVEIKSRLIHDCNLRMALCCKRVIIVVFNRRIKWEISEHRQILFDGDEAIYMTLSRHTDIEFILWIRRQQICRRLNWCYIVISRITKIKLHKLIYERGLCLRIGVLADTCSVNTMLSKCMW